MIGAEVVTVPCKSKGCFDEGTVGHWKGDAWCLEHLECSATTETVAVLERDVASELGAIEAELVRRLSRDRACLEQREEVRRA